MMRPSWTAQTDEARFLFSRAERIIEDSRIDEFVGPALSDEEIELAHKAIRMLAQARLIEANHRHRCRRESDDASD